MTTKGIAFNGLLIPRKLQDIVEIICSIFWVIIILSSMQQIRGSLAGSFFDDKLDAEELLLIDNKLDLILELWKDNVGLRGSFFKEIASLFINGFKIFVRVSKFKLFLPVNISLMPDLR